MKCPTCEADNPQGARFCMGCGASLRNACPECGTELPANAQFCFNCGHQLGKAAAPAAARTEPTQRRIEQYIPAELLAKLESSRTTGGMQGERRVVTMLFCDVKGSTAAAERLDPEEWAEIMNGAFERLIAPVYRYEGTLARLMGDAILAFFGAPIGHEDDPERAVLAGLDIIQALAPYREEVRGSWGIDFDVRVGINTGLVVVGEVGSDLRVEYTALGDAVNLASRMEQTAQPGTVQITEYTHRVIAPLFEFEDLGPIEVRGKEEPVRAYGVLRAKAEPGRLRGIEGLDAPLVGRESEMRALQSIVAELADGRGAVCAVMAEAGLGKSRLVAELRRGLSGVGASTNGNGDRGAEIAWLEGRSLSYETSTPYAPFVDLLSECFGLRPEQSDADKYAAVSARASELMNGRGPDVAPLMGTMLGLELPEEDAERVKYLEPPQLRDRLFRATCDMLEALAASRPLVLVFEDLHWVDPTSLDLLEGLMPLTDRVPLVIVALFRPQRQDPSWRFHEVASRDFEHRYTPLFLEPLDEEGSRALVAGLLHVEGLPESMRALILRKSEGNPFFVEEVIRSLLDAGVVVPDGENWRATHEIEDIAVPDTLTALLTTRLDRLDDESRRVVQTAAVIGREFPFDAMAEVYESPERLDQAFTDLQRRGLIREKSRLPQRLYTFKHALTQETAYASLLLSRRRDLHRTVAEWLERVDSKRVNDIGRHFLAAREHARALPYLVEAGDTAARAYSTPEAIRHYTQAIEALDRVDDRSLVRRAHEGLASALAFANDATRAVEVYRTMLHLARSQDDAPMQVSALNKMALVVGMQLGQFEEAMGHLEASEALARERQDTPGLAELHMIQCNFCTARADFDGAVDHLAEAAAIGRELELEEPKLYGLTHIANTQTFMARFGDAWQTAQEARQLAEEVRNLKYLSELLTFSIPMAHLNGGDLETARQVARQGMDLATQIGSASAHSSGAFWLGQMARLQGDYGAALSYLSQALDAARVSGMPWTIAMDLCSLGGVYVEIGPSLFERAAVYHTEAQEVMELPGGLVTGATSWGEMGFCAAVAGDLETAAALFDRGLTTPTAPMYLMRPLLLCGVASVAMARRDMDRARKAVEEAREFVETRGMAHLRPAVTLAAAGLSAALGDAEEALEGFARAEALATNLGLRPIVLQARAGSAQVLSSLGRDGEAKARLQAATAVSEEMAGLIGDAELRQAFLDAVNPSLTLG